MSRCRSLGAPTRHPVTPAAQHLVGDSTTTNSRRPQVVGATITTTTTASTPLSSSRLPASSTGSSTATSSDGSSTGGPLQTFRRRFGRGNAAVKKQRAVSLCEGDEQVEDEWQAPPQWADSRAVLEWARRCSRDDDSGVAASDTDDAHCPSAGSSCKDEAFSESCSDGRSEERSSPCPADPLCGPPTSNQRQPPHIVADHVLTINTAAVLGRRYHRNSCVSPLSSNPTLTPEANNITNLNNANVSASVNISQTPHQPYAAPQLYTKLPSPGMKPMHSINTLHSASQSPPSHFSHQSTPYHYSSPHATPNNNNHHQIPNLPLTPSAIHPTALYSHTLSPSRNPYQQIAPSSSPNSVSNSPPSLDPRLQNRSQHSSSPISMTLGRLPRATRTDCRSSHRSPPPTPTRPAHTLSPHRRYSTYSPVPTMSPPSRVATTSPSSPHDLSIHESLVSPPPFQSPKSVNEPVRSPSSASNKPDFNRSTTYSSNDDDPDKVSKHLLSLYMDSKVSF